MTLTLTATEIALLKEILADEHTSLSEEIHHTRDHDFKQALRDKIHAVDALAKKIDGHHG